MISILGEGLWARNSMPPCLSWDSRQTLRRFCGACVLSERCASIRLLSSQSIPFSSVEFYHVDTSTRSSCSCVCEWSGEGKKENSGRARVGGWGGRQVHFRKRSSGSWCLTPNVGWTRNHSVSQRAFASQHGEKAHGFALYGRHRVAGIKGRLCFIKRKGKGYISNNRNFKQKNIDFLRQKRTVGKNLWTFSRLESCFVFFFSRFSGNSRSLSTLATGGCFSHA